MVIPTERCALQRLLLDKIWTVCLFGCLLRWGKCSFGKPTGGCHMCFEFGHVLALFRLSPVPSSKAQALIEREVSRHWKIHVWRWKQSDTHSKYFALQLKQVAHFQHISTSSSEVCECCESRCGFKLELSAKSDFVRAMSYETADSQKEEFRKYLERLGNKGLSMAEPFVT